MRCRAMAVLAALLPIVGNAFPSAAQYFGRNKVQYQTVRLQGAARPSTSTFTTTPRKQAAVEIAARMAERWYARLTRLLGHELRGRQPLILYAAHPHFEQTNVVSG